MVNITTYQPRNQPCSATGKQVRNRIRNENRKRRGQDPLHGKKWWAYCRVRRFPGGRPFLELRGSFRKHYTTPSWALTESNYPAHMTLPWGAEHRVNQIIAQKKYRVSFNMQKATGSLSSTTYGITGGSLRGILNTLENEGWHPPRNWRWHISM